MFFESKVFDCSVNADHISCFEIQRSTVAGFGEYILIAHLRGGGRVFMDTADQVELLDKQKRAYIDVMEGRGRRKL